MTARKLLGLPKPLPLASLCALQLVLSLAVLTFTLYLYRAITEERRAVEAGTARATCHVLAYVLSSAQDENVSTALEEGGLVCRMRLASGPQLWWRWSDYTWRLQELAL